MIGGVCLGLSEYFGGDVTFFRIGFALTGFLGGFGVLVYLISYFCMPWKPKD